jgi:hypothetical protein
MVDVQYFYQKFSFWGAKIAS